MAGKIDYGTLMHQALRGLIQSVLRQVAQDGLPADHHFFITFDTRHPQVDIAEWLHERYPEEMTIVLQHWFDGLDVGEDGFAVTLNFGNRPEPLYIPFDSLQTFVDPSVEFGLRFEGYDDESEGVTEAEELPIPEAPAAEAPMAEDVVSDEDDAPREAEVVSLDQFRK